MAAWPSAIRDDERRPLARIAREHRLEPDIGSALHHHAGRVTKSEYVVHAALIA